ncbi:MAG: flagellar biosynthesis protein FliQ [Clostridiaceae bacterium]|nr:flagellar biosynthesis protein FliQ [Clostridiaceae bacterium]
MSQNLVAEIIKDAIYTAIKVGGPILVVAMVIGLIISIIQATTQIQEQTLTFVPKVIAIAVVGIIAGSWMLQTIMAFTKRIFELIVKIST